VRRRDTAKRAFDLMIATPVLVLLSPVMGGIAFGVRVIMGRPLLFRQVRAGLHGRSFTILKFRTMAEAWDEEGRLLSDDSRITGFGRFLRSTSLDELPELWNVVRGEMSLVGPRPLLMQYLERYTPEQRRRHNVRPGLTGWAQVNGRNSLTWEERLAMDVWYVDQRSMALDIKILLLTLLRVVTRRGIAAPGYATMPEFTGPVHAEGDTDAGVGA
jgi:sugar transferase EpsL